MKHFNIDMLWMHLHWLTVLAEQKSFTRAAERLEVSKAAMSQKIKELEQVAGVALVQRTTRSVRLTNEGQKLVEELRQPFSDIEQSFLAMRDSSGPVRGMLRITAPVAFARQQLVPHLSSFLKEYPEIRIQLEVSDQVISLTKEGFEIAIRHSDNLPETCVALPLCSTRTILVASPAYIAIHGIPKHPNELVTYDCLYYPRGTDLPSWNFVHRDDMDNVLSVNVKGQFATNNSESIRDAALNGLGIAMLPDFSAKAAIISGELIEILPDWQIVRAFADKIWIVRPYSAQVPRPVTTFTYWLRSKFSIDKH